MHNKYYETVAPQRTGRGPTSLGGVRREQRGLSLMNLVAQILLSELTKNASAVKILGIDMADLPAHLSRCGCDVIFRNDIML